MSDRPVLVVGNASAGRRNRRVVEAAVGRLATRTPVELAWTESAEDIDELLAATGAERVVAAGGDGSVSALVNALDRIDRLDLEIAILPFGTGNDLAGALGITDLDSALDAASGSSTTAITGIRTDLGLAVNAVHLGVGATAAARASALKPGMGPAAYPLAALTAGVTYEPFGARLEIDGEQADGERFTMVALANSWRIGGGFPVAPGASAEEPRMDVVVVRETSVLDRLRLAAAGRTGHHLELPFVERHRCRSARVETAGVGANRDGELHDDVAVLEAEVVPALVQVCVPPVPAGPRSS